MINSGKLIQRFVLGLAAWVIPALPALAQESSKPALVISIAKPDKLLADVGFLTRAAGTPEFGGLVTLMSGPYLQGIDTKRPAGIYVHFSGPQPTGVAFVPVTDASQLFKQLENQSIEVEDAGDGLKKIQLQRTIYLKEKDGWLFVTDAEGNLDNLPKNPGADIATMAEKYNLAVQLNVRNIDPTLIDMAVSEMKAGFERSLEAEVDEEKKALQESVGRQSMENIVRFLEESDQITVGWGVDSKVGATFLDFSLTAIAGSKLAEQMTGYEKLTSSFTGVNLPDAAAVLRFTAPITKEEIAQAREAIKAVRAQAMAQIDEDEDLPDDDTRDEAKSILNEVFDIAVATLEGGKLDGGAVLTLNDETIHFVGGGSVSDGKAVREVFKRFVELAKETSEEDVGLDEVEFNAEKHAGVDFHTLTIPIPEDEEQAQEVLGEELNVVVGTGAKAAFLAFGDDPGELLKRVIDASAEAKSKTVLPLEFSIALTPILEYAASLEEDPVVDALAESIKTSAGKDKIRMTQRAIKGGISGRLEVEEGVLKLIGAAVKARNESSENN